MPRSFTSSSKHPKCSQPSCFHYSLHHCTPGIRHPVVWERSLTDLFLPPHTLLDLLSVLCFFYFTFSALAVFYSLIIILSCARQGPVCSLEIISYPVLWKSYLLPGGRPAHWSASLIQAGVDSPLITAGVRIISYNSWKQNNLLPVLRNISRIYSPCTFKEWQSH